MYEFVTHPSLLDVASDLLGTEEVSVHGIFNARPKLPDQSWSTTPWHQDGQYYRDSAGAEVISMWIPMQPVNKQNSCLQVAPGTFSRELREAVMDDVYRNIGLSEADSESLAADHGRDGTRGRAVLQPVRTAPSAAQHLGRCALVAGRPVRAHGSCDRDRQEAGVSRSQP